MDTILEVIASFLFAGAIAEWRRRRELRRIEAMIKGHYGDRGENPTDEQEPTVSVVRRLMSSDVRLAMRLDRARKRKEAEDIRIAELERMRALKTARRLDVVARIRRLLMITAIVLTTCLFAVLLISRGHASPTTSTDMRDHKWVEITRPMLVCLSSGGRQQDRLAKAQMQLSIASWLAGQREPLSCYIFQKGKKVELNPSQPIDAMEFTEYCNGCSPYASDYYGPSETLIGKYTRDSNIPDEYMHYFKR